MPAIPGLKVVRSPIHGYGVIALRDFAAGEIVAEVDGVLYRDDEIEDDTYALLLDDGWLFDMVDQTRWMNHSCDPNCEIEGGVDDEGHGWARVVAIRPISAGEEITYDYAFSADIAEPCRCGSRACRGFIVDAEELPALLARRCVVGSSSFGS